MQEDLERLVSLAQIVRQAFEEHAKNVNLPKDLSGLCYDASIVLMRLAKRHGINRAQVGVGIAHWFVLLDDMVVDVTSTQFKQPDKVAVLPLDHAEKIGCWWKLQERLGDSEEWIESSHTKAGHDIVEKLLKSGGVGEEALKENSDGLSVQTS